MKKLLTLLALLLPLEASAQSQDYFAPMTAADYGLEVAFDALTVYDWGQSRDIQNRYRTQYQGRNWWEKNPVLGKHPSDGKMAAYFLGAMVVHGVVSYALPKPYRTIWQAGTIFVEFDVVRKNARVGLKFDLM